VAQPASCGAGPSSRWRPRLLGAQFCSSDGAAHSPGCKYIHFVSTYADCVCFMGCNVRFQITGSTVVGRGAAMQLCKSEYQMLPASCRYTVSATLRIGCDRQLGSRVMGMLQLGYVVLQVALCTHPDPCQAQLLQKKGFTTRLLYFLLRLYWKLQWPLGRITKMGLLNT